MEENMSTTKRETPYLERDISWMYFNRRILQEATRKNVPLLERMSFLGIYSNNLDEFYRVRISSQSRIAECEDRQAQKESQQALKVLKIIGKLNGRYMKEYEAAVEQITEDLHSENICIVSDKDVTPEQLEFIRNYYKEKLSGLMTPIWLSATKSLDSASDENIYMALKVKKKKPKSPADYAIIELPVNLCGRFVRLPDEGEKRYLMYLDDVVRCCLPLLF